MISGFWIKLFPSCGLFKQKSEENQFVSIDKYYEPQISISEKYFIDYYRNCTYEIKVKEEIKEVFLLKYKFLPAT